MNYSENKKIFFNILKIGGDNSLKVIDLHSDIFTDIAFRRERGETRVFERIHLPKLRKGGITGLICVFWVEPSYRGLDFMRFHQLLHYAIEDLKECPAVELVSTFPDETNLIKHKLYVLLGIEGLSFMEFWTGRNKEEKVLNALDYLMDKKQIYHSIFAWNEVNFLASGTGCNVESEKRGLSPTGEIAVREMQKRNWSIDVSHLDEPSFWDVVRSSQKPLLASHSNVRTLCDSERNLTDEQIKAIAGSGGLIGVNAYGSFVHDTTPTLSYFIDHIAYIAELVGVEYVAFGFDFVDYLQNYDLGSTFSNLTKGLEDVTRVPDLIDKMINKGFSSSEIEQVCFLNSQRFFQISK